jgi:hypothetical protein
VASDPVEYLVTIFLVGGGGQQILTRLRPSEIRPRFRRPEDGWIILDGLAPSAIKQPVVFEILAIHVMGFCVSEAIEQRVQAPPPHPSTIVGARH